MSSPPPNVIAAAVREAMRSPCAKSKRGAILYPSIWEYPAENVGGICAQHNGPPGEIACDGSAECRASCGKRCMHAEARTIRAGLQYASMEHRRGRELDAYELVHVKVVDGQLVAGGGPSCMPCAVQILDVGVAGVWLYEEMFVDGKLGKLSVVNEKFLAQGEWRRYTAADFARATARACGVHWL